MTPRAPTPLALARKGRGLTQAAAAARAGISQQQWCALETRDRPAWSWSTWRRILAVLGGATTLALFAAYLTVDADKPPPPPAGAARPRRRPRRRRS